MIPPTGMVIYHQLEWLYTTNWNGCIPLIQIKVRLILLPLLENLS